MTFKLKANSSGQFYFPKRIREEWGHELELVLNMRSGVLYPVGTSATEVLESLQTALLDLQHRAKLEKGGRGKSKIARPVDLPRRVKGEMVPQSKRHFNVNTKDEVEIIEKHFNARRTLDKRFKRALKKSEFSTEAEFFRFHMMQFVYDFEREETRVQTPLRGVRERIRDQHPQIGERKPRGRLGA